MPAIRLPKFAWNAALVTLCALHAGCAFAPGSRDALAANPTPVHTSERGPSLAQSTPPAANPVLRQGAEVQWSVQSATAPPSRSMAGKAVVGPDGTIELGPYGSVHVAGLTYGQAKTVVVKHLSIYVEHPQVALAPVGTLAVAKRGTAAQQQPATTVVQTQYRGEKPALMLPRDESQANNGPSTVTWSTWQPAVASSEPAAPQTPAPAPGPGQRLRTFFHIGG